MVRSNALNENDMKDERIPLAEPMFPQEHHAPALKNRIVGYGDEAPDQLLANPRNWRIHSQFQQDALQGVLESVGWVRKVLVNRTTQHIVDGHARVAIALKRGEASVPVEYIEVSEEEEALILATLDPIASLADTDGRLVRELIREIKTDDEDVRRLLDTIAEDAPADSAGDGVKDETVLLDQAIQLKPGREFVVIIADAGAEWEKLRALLGLQLVRRGGYKVGSEFDDVSVNRTMKARDLFVILNRADPL